MGLLKTAPVAVLVLTTVTGQITQQQPVAVVDGRPATARRVTWPLTTAWQANASRAHTFEPDTSNEDPGNQVVSAFEAIASDAGAMSMRQLAASPAVVPPDLPQPLVTVHVMETCCPHRSRYALGRYPSELDKSGWAPGMSFVAYAFAASLANCWAIASASANDSQIWQPIAQGVPHTSTQPPSATEKNPLAFCLPTFSNYNSTAPVDGDVLYVETPNATASYITQPTLPPSTTMGLALDLPGWAPSAEITTKTKLYPISYYLWRAVLPIRIVRDAWLEVVMHSARRRCTNGHKVAGNFNFGYVMEPNVHLCVQYSAIPMINPWLGFPDANTTLTFLTRVELMYRNPNLENITCDTGKETARVVVDRNPDPARPDARMPKDYRWSTALGYPYIICLTKSPLVVDGQSLPTDRFVTDLKVDETKRRRHHRLFVEYGNPPSLSLLKRISD